MRRRGAIAVVLMLLSAAAAADAQVRLAGRVISDTQEPVRSAAVRVRAGASPSSSLPEGEVWQTSTDAAGRFAIALARAGAYRIDVRGAGFYAIEDQAVSIAETATELTLVLVTIREYAESTSVQGRDNPLALDRPATQQSLSGQDLINVPYPGSESLKNGLRLLPGVVQDGFTGIHVNGAPEYETLFLLDGFNVGDPLTGRFDPRVSVDAVRSLTVVSGASPAEYGKGSAGAVEITTNTGDDRRRVSASTFVPVIGNQKGWRVLDWTPRFTASGPIKTSRAWFTNNATGEFHQWVVPELPRGSDTTERIRFSDYVHAQINATPSNTIHTAAMVSVGRFDNDGLSALDPESTTLDARSRQVLINVRDRAMLRGSMLLEVGYGSNRTYARWTPKGDAPYVTTPSGRSGNHYFNSIQHSSRDQAIANLFLPTFAFGGTHQMKAGLDVDHLGHDRDTTRGTIRLLDAQNQPIRTIAYAGSGSVAVTNDEVAAYVQDAWRVSNDAVVQMGVRADWDRRVADWSASPRVGVAWSAFGRDTTRVSGGYGVTHDATRLQVFARPHDQTPLSTFYPPYGSGTQPVRFTFAIPDDLSSPSYRTWNVAVDRRVTANLYARAQGLGRRGTNGLAYFGTPSIDRDTTYTLSNGRTESYRAVEISARQTFRQDYGWMASYTRSRVRSNAVKDIGPDDYFIPTDNSGPLDWDAPNRFVSWAYLPTFRPKWSIGYLLEYRTGFPFSAANDAGIIVGPANAYRYPAHFELDLDLERTITFRGHVWAARVAVNNITNHFNATAVNASVSSPQFGTFYGGGDRILVFRLRWLGRAKPAK